MSCQSSRYAGRNFADDFWHRERDGASSNIFFISGGAWLGWPPNKATLQPTYVLAKRYIRNGCCQTLSFEHQEMTHLVNVDEQIKLKAHYPQLVAQTRSTDETDISSKFIARVPHYCKCPLLWCPSSSSETVLCSTYGLSSNTSLNHCYFNAYFLRLYCKG